MNVLSVCQISKSYGALRAVDGVSFGIDAGEVYGLLGPNGAGKSTTINMIATLLTPDGGQVTIQSPGGNGSSDVRRLIGLVPQEISLTDKLTARECLRFFGRLYDIRGRDLRDRVERRLADVGLTDRGDDRVKTFSGGMQRRLNIAAGLLHDPVLLLLDEPTAGVDPHSRAFIFDIVEKLAASGVAVLYTTHYMEEAQRLCRRIGIMDHGHVLAEGTLTELIDQTDAKRVVCAVSDDLDESRAKQLAADVDDVPFEFADGQLRLIVPDPQRALQSVVRAADRLGIGLQSINVLEPNLETVFLELTGHGLRD